MRQGNIIAYIVYFILFFVLQVIFFRNVMLFNYSFCFIYVGYILIFPIDVKPIILMLMAFFFGLVIDSFFDTVGMNAFVCVFIAYVRPYILKVLTPAGGYDAMTEISIPYMGFIWFIKYASLVIFIHHFLFFLIEAWDISNFMTIFIKAIFSTIFTLSMIILLQYLIGPSNRYERRS